jgi:DNA-binding response OmpR family regulator
MKKILIIEDDRLVANIYRNKFAVEDFQVETATDGEAGLELVKSFKPDAVVLDLMLPNVTGVDVLKQIRAEAGLQQMPVIVLSNTFLSNMVQEAWKAGATKCLSKANCTPKHIIDVVRSVLQSGPAASVQVVSNPTTTSPSQPKSGAAHAPIRTEEALQYELVDAFLASLPATLSDLRAIMQTLSKSKDEASRVQTLQDLYRNVHGLTANAAIAGMTQIAQMADALEALIKELYEKPKNINASTIRTVALAVDFLGTLFDKAKLTGVNPAPTPPRPNILVVDDEAISRRAITHALEKAKLPCTSEESPEVALSTLAERAFDLVFLDVDMPGMNGFELCTKLRALHRNKSTPVVFVTNLSDFESRASSAMSGGNDLIAKPFIFMELAVKALIFILRGRLAAAR